MAGFFPHVGNCPGGYTPLPVVPVTGFLDSLVNDLTSSAGGGVNGWTLYDDMRGAGTGSTVYPSLFTQWGYTNAPGTSYGAVSMSWTAITGSQSAVGRYDYGFHWAYCINYDQTNPTPISWDKTNWYNAYYRGGGANMSTATLDRNFAQTSRNSQFVFTKVDKQVVFRCSGSYKTFYVWMGQRLDVAGTPIIYTRVYEAWDSGTHTGTTGSAMEHTRVFLTGQPPMSATMQYMAWFLPDAFGLWTYGRDIREQSLGSRYATFTYIGLLSQSNPADTDGLIFATSDTSYSGMCTMSDVCITSNPDSTSRITFGGAQCLRTRSGVAWASATSSPAVGINLDNQYQIVPRNRWCGANFGGPAIDAAGRVHLAHMDAFHVSPPLNPWIGEGIRGTLKHVKCPVTNPNGLPLATVGPFNDGNSYVLLNVNAPFMMNASWGQINTTTATEPGNHGWNTQFALVSTAFAWGTKNPATQNYTNITYQIYGEYASGVNKQGNIQNWFAMPII